MSECSETASAHESPPPPQMPHSSTSPLCTATVQFKFTHSLTWLPQFDIPAIPSRYT